MSKTRVRETKGEANVRITDRGEKVIERETIVSIEWWNDLLSDDNISLGGASLND